MTADLSRYQRELLADPARCDRILAALPPTTPEPETVIVRVRSTEVDRGICRALAVSGISAHVEFIEETDES